MMALRRLFYLTILVLIGISCSSEKKVSETTSEKPEQPASPRREAAGDANGVNIVIDYGSPQVKGRKIWGGLEKYDRVWRAGANETTTISLDKNATIDGEPLDQGKYALFIIPKEEEDWVVIFNTDWDEWGAFSYNQENDVLRLAVSPTWEETNQEQLRFSIEDGQIRFSWEKVRLAMDVNAEQ